MDDHIDMKMILKSMAQKIISGLRSKGYKVTVSDSDNRVSGSPSLSVVNEKNKTGVIATYGFDASTGVEDNDSLSLHVMSDGVISWDSNVNIVEAHSTIQDLVLKISEDIPDGSTRSAEGKRWTMTCGNCGLVWVEEDQIEPDYICHKCYSENVTSVADEDTATEEEHNTLICTECDKDFSKSELGDKTDCPECGGKLIGKTESKKKEDTVEETTYVCDKCGMVHDSIPEGGKCTKDGCDGSVVETEPASKEPASEEVGSYECIACKSTFSTSEIGDDKKCPGCGGDLVAQDVKGQTLSNSREQVDASWTCNSCDTKWSSTIDETNCPKCDSDDIKKEESKKSEGDEDPYAPGEDPNDYVYVRCHDCNHIWEPRGESEDYTPPCPECGSSNVSETKTPPPK